MSTHQVRLTIYALLFAIAMVRGIKKTTLKQKMAPKVEKNSFSSGSRESLGAATSKEDDRKRAYLPGDIKPIHYDIQYTFGMEVLTIEELASWEGFPFYGVVSIKIKALKCTSEITLHAHNKYFTVDKNRTKVMSGNTCLPIASIQQLEANYQLLTINLKKKLIASRVYTIVIPFNGTLLNDNDIGMIVSVNSKTIGSNDTIREYAEFTLIVMSQPDGARRVFPCFDEPRYKATFSVTVGHHKNYSTVLSNMPLLRTLKNNPMEKYWTWKPMNKLLKCDFRWEQFEKSPLMSTYLLTFSVSNFTYIESPPGSTKTPIRTYVTYDRIHQAEYISQVAPKLFEYFENYWNMSYHVPKLDLVIIEIATEIHGFESWGHIYLRKASVLFEPKSDILQVKFMGSMIIAHELAHQMFGNLVTPKSWDEIWLSEGFATYLSNKPFSKILENILDNGIAQDVFMTWQFLSDKKGRHALSTPVDPSKLGIISFDLVEYTTGSLIVRMLFNYVGEEVCRKVLHKYLTKHSYGNVDKDDLWAVFDEDQEVKRILGKHVTMKKLMDSWVTIADYPVLTVTRNYGHNTLTLRQQPHDECETRGGIDVCKDFKQEKTLKENTKVRSLKSFDGDDKVSWWLPLNMLVQGKNITRTKKWLTDSEGVDSAFSMKHCAKDDQWVLFNTGLIAPYRVNYDTTNWNLLIRELNKPEENSSIPHLSQQQLLEDAQVFGGLKVHTATIANVAKLLENLKKEHFITHAASLDAFENINQKMERTPEYEIYKKYMANIIQPAYEKLGGIQGDNQTSKHDMLQQNMQMTVSAWSCRLQVPGCQEKALEMFQQWRHTRDPDNDNPIPIHARHTSVCVALSHDAPANIEFVSERVRRARSFAEQSYLLAALACTNDTSILTRLLEWSIAEDSAISIPDASWLMTSIASKPSAFEAAKNFLYSRTADIVSIFSRNKRWYLKDFIKNIIKNISTQKELDEFLQWRKENGPLLEELDFVMDLTLKSAARNVEWMNKDKMKFVQKLRMGV